MYIFSCAVVSDVLPARLLFEKIKESLIVPDIKRHIYLAAVDMSSALVPIYKPLVITRVLSKTMIKVFCKPIYIQI